jgi:C_GCAxxG_C_C family probable redox protein
MINDRADKAFETMANRKMNCAQAVFTSFCEELGLEKKLALSIAQGFGGGMAHTGGTCGAVTGAYVALGLAQKYTTENPRDNIDKTYALINEFNRKFKEINGSLNCTELTGYDLSKPEKLAEAREKGVFITKCPEFVRDSVKIVEGLLKLT